MIVVVHRNAGMEPAGTPAACGRRCGRVAILALAWAAAWSGPATAAESLPLAATGVAIVPEDAAFFSATLRLGEQVELLSGSRAWKKISELPAVRRALDSLEAQRTAPGSPLAVVETLMQLPENEQALALLRDMVATDTFVYGEPSCIGFLELSTKIQRAMRAAAVNLRTMEGDLDDDARAAPRPRFLPVARETAEADLSAEEVQARLLVRTLSENLDLLAVPDVVWGFRTTRVETAAQQLKRLEVLGKLVTQAMPDFAESLERVEIAGGDFLTFTLEADRLPLASLAREFAGDLADTPEGDAVLERLESLELVVALGVIGDRVVLSIGDSTDHLEKLVAPAGGADAKRPGGLLQGKPLAPLRAVAAERVTGVSYMSADMARAILAGQVDLQPAVDAAVTAAEEADLSDDAVGDLREFTTSLAEWYSRQLPVPGPWMAYSFLGDRGYEGAVWDWGTNHPFDSSRRLDLLKHAGGDPLAVLVTRVKQAPQAAEELAGFVERGLSLLREHGLPRLDEEARERAEAALETFGPLAAELAGIIRDKLAAAVADGQVGFLFDAKGSAAKLQRDLPASDEPLPVPEAAIVLPLADAKLFKDGLNDLFALTDKVVDAARALDPDAIPEGYRVPEPEKTRADAGTVWSFALPRSGIDDQVRPAIGVGDGAAVFCFAPAHAARVLDDAELTTGRDVTRFEQPLATAAAIDVAGLFSALEPWVIFAGRYAGVQSREGSVDSDRTLAAADETPEVRDALAHVRVVFEVMRCLREVVAETSSRDGALVTRWQNVIRDLPAE